MCNDHKCLVYIYLKALFKVNKTVDYKENKTMVDTREYEMANVELTEEELENVAGGDILLGVALIGGGIAFAYGAYVSYKNKCKKK